MKTFKDYIREEVSPEGDDPTRAGGCLFVAYVGDQKLFAVAKRSKSCSEPGTYGPVGGMIKKDESPQDGISREVFEEIGLVVQPKALVWLHDHRDNPNFTYFTYAVVVEQSFLDGADLNDENDHIRWFSLNSPPTPLHPGFAKCLADPAVRFRLEAI